MDDPRQLRNAIRARIHRLRKAAKHLKVLVTYTAPHADIRRR
jgi:hypothetical protein